jgi:hypothetical protein
MIKGSFAMPILLGYLFGRRFPKTSTALLIAMLWVITHMGTVVLWFLR